MEGFTCSSGFECFVDVHSAKTPLMALGLLEMVEGADIEHPRLA
jgi:hypothetical protein